jgi:cysteine synthase
VLEVDQIDEIVKVSNQQAFAIARELAHLEGIPGGISTGAILAAGLEVAARPHMAGKLMVVIAPSFAERYLSTALFETA